MKSIRSLTLATFVVLGAAAWSSRAVAVQPQNPACGQQVLLKRGASTLGSSSNLRFNINSMGAIGSCATTVSAIHLVSSPSGLADTTATGDFPGLFIAPVNSGTTTAVSGVSELWAQSGAAFDTPELSSTQYLECDDPILSTDFEPIFYSNVTNSGGTSLYYPAAAGGDIYFATKFCTDPFDLTATYCYGWFLIVHARSTDRDGDGDTDEDDENSLRSASSGDPSADLNYNGTVHDATDLAILIREENRRDGSGLPFKRGQCLNRTDTSPFTYVGPYHTYRPATPTITTTGGCYQVEIDWTDTGDDSLTGQATFYSVRRSTSAITTANWASATEIATGAPGTSGTYESVFNTGLSPCSAHYYYAVRLQDDVGNWSAIGSAQGWTLCPHIGDCEDGLVTGGGSDEPDTRYFALAHGTPTTLSAPASLRFTIPVPLRGHGLSLDIMDLNGRLVRHLDGGVASGPVTDVRWDLHRNDGSITPPGVYFMRANVGPASLVQRLVLIR